jgi:hypothetical protein
MPFVFKRLALFMSIAAAFAADKDTGSFKPAPAASFAHKQTNGAVTIGVDAYNSGDKVKTAFGKVDPYEHGLLPVLVVIQNDGNQAIRLDALKVEYNGPDRPKVMNGPMGKPKVLKPKKNPLNEWEIEGRAFSAKMLPPGQSASGFFYFQTGLRAGSTIYLNGLEEAGSGKQLLFFEIPLE